MARYDEVLDINARSSHKGGKQPKPELRDLNHSRSSNGGHVFEHRFTQPGGPYKEAEQHTFGQDEGRKALEHFAEHAGLSEHLGAAPNNSKPEAEDANTEEA